MALAAWQITSLKCVTTALPVRAHAYSNVVFVVLLRGTPPLFGDAALSVFKGTNGGRVWSKVRDAAHTANSGNNKILYTVSAGQYVYILHYNGTDKLEIVKFDMTTLAFASFFPSAITGSSFVPNLLIVRSDGSFVVTGTQSGSPYFVTVSPTGTWGSLTVVTFPFSNSGTFGLGVSNWIHCFAINTPASNEIWHNNINGSNAVGTATLINPDDAMEFLSNNALTTSPDGPIIIMHCLRKSGVPLSMSLSIISGAVAPDLFPATISPLPMTNDPWDLTNVLKQSEGSRKVVALTPSADSTEVRYILYDPLNSGGQWGSFQTYYTHPSGTIYKIFGSDLGGRTDSPYLRLELGVVFSDTSNFWYFLAEELPPVSGGIFNYAF